MASIPSNRNPNDLSFSYADHFGRGRTQRGPDFEGFEGLNSIRVPEGSCADATGPKSHGGRAHRCGRVRHAWYLVLGRMLACRKEESCNLQPAAVGTLACGLEHSEDSQDEDFYLRWCLSGILSSCSQHTTE